MNKTEVLEKVKRIGIAEMDSYLRRRRQAIWLLTYYSLLLLFQFFIKFYFAKLYTRLVVCVYTKTSSGQ